MYELARVESGEQVRSLVALAREIWTEHYPPIIGDDQVAYMLNAFQSEEAITTQLAEGYEYYLATRDGQPCGYMAVVDDPEQDALMLSKLYVLRSERRRGLAGKMVDLAEAVCREKGFTALWLSVNKNNDQSIAWYLRRGFENAGPFYADIGAGFVMDDYRMKKAIS